MQNALNEIRDLRARLQNVTHPSRAESDALRMASYAERAMSEYGELNAMAEELERQRDLAQQELANLRADLARIGGAA